nr:uncharacterized protein LOC105477403 isoform X4 [Macaca nemestrina]
MNIVSMNTFLDVSFGEHVPSFLLDIYLGVELLAHKEDICLILVDTCRQFSKAAEPISFRSSNVQELQLISYLNVHGDAEAAQPLGFKLPNVWCLKKMQDLGLSILLNVKRESSLTPVAGRLTRVWLICFAAMRSSPLWEEEHPDQQLQELGSLQAVWP